MLKKCALLPEATNCSAEDTKYKLLQIAKEKARLKHLAFKIWFQLILAACAAAYILTTVLYTFTSLAATTPWSVSNRSACLLIFG